LRKQTAGRLFVVFGCGGEADTGVRSMMGAIAAAHADGVIVTDDNPRGEDPAQIRAQIRIGAPDAVEIGDRADAIRRTMRGLKSGDALVVAGKGHETTQLIAGIRYPFEDAAIVREAADGLRSA
jgi:UDP-N-acetylmuramoyl-L-alanyl-D-glutamate--2,6-diaminopimelate ligase